MGEIKLYGKSSKGKLINVSGVAFLALELVAIAELWMWVGIMRSEAVAQGLAPQSVP